MSDYQGEDRRVRHYADQLKLALFPELVEALDKINQLAKGGYAVSQEGTLFRHALSIARGALTKVPK